MTGRDFAVIPGGKGANQACAAARLGGDVAMVGRVGADAYGELLRASLAAAGVDVSHLRGGRHTHTGVALIAVDAAGQNEIVIVPGANGTSHPGGARARAATSGRAPAVVLLQLEVPLATVEAAARLARRAGARVILDPAPAAAAPVGAAAGGRLPDAERDGAGRAGHGAAARGRIRGAPRRPAGWSGAVRATWW